jgi:predicted secreted Zn-dependent protease
MSALKFYQSLAYEQQPCVSIDWLKFAEAYAKHERNLNRRAAELLREIESETTSPSAWLLSARNKWLKDVGFDK